MTAYEWSDRLDELVQSRSFITEILLESLDNAAIQAEFSEKLKKIDNEINELLK